MNSFHRTVLAGAICAISLTASAAAAQKAPLDYKVYDGWNRFAGVAISHDGAWMAYGVAPEDGDGTLVVRDLGTGREIREPRGKAPLFSDNSQIVFYTISLTAAELDAARRAHKRPDQLPREGFGVLVLPSGTAFTADRVKRYAFAKHGSQFVAYLQEPAARASASPSPAPSASASPVPDNKKKAETSTLMLRDIAAGTSVTIPSVSEFAISDDEHYLAYATETTDGAGDGVHVRDLRNGTVADVATGSGRYIKPAFAPSTDNLAFVTDRASYSEAAPHFEVYLWSPGAAAAHAIVTSTSRGLPSGWSPSADGAVTFSKDGQRLFVGANVAPTPLPKNTPDPMQVDLWNWHDGRLQSEQKVEAGDDRTRTYLGVYDVGAQRYIQLGSPNLATIETNDNAAFALGHNALPYLAQRSWDDFFDDEYAVSLQTGSKHLVSRRQREGCELSPAGKYVLCYDRIARAWYTVRTSDWHKTYLTRNLKVAFYDELDDHPAPPPPYGSAGWLDGDRRVLLLDRYDIWSVDPNGANAYRLTNGFGRANALRFVPVQLDPEKTSVDPNAVMYLSAFNDRAKSNAFYRLADANKAAAPQVLFAAPEVFGTLLKAKNAGRYFFTRQRFAQFPDFWSAGASLAHPARVTNINPQAANYLWGTEQLVHYTSLEGKHLDGILILPENFNPKRRYPMLVYFYERLADTLHRFYSPAPSTGPVFARYVSNGYVVLLPDIAYTTGHPGRNAYDAVMPAIDSVVRRGFIDTKRIGVSGHSWGAYQIAYILTRTHRFAAAEAGAAVADMVSAYGGIRWGSGLVREFQYEQSQSRIGATPWDRPDLYLENSALFHIRNVRTPYLTIANDNDDAVPWYQGIEFFTALRRLNREAYMFSFNGEFHNLRGREQQKYWTVHFDEFFDHFLKGKPAPQWMTKGVDYLHRGERNVRPLFGEKP
ncbi:MAG TPA: prolyl oligopeptidase family serine peptidase [Candidatus Rubrimentiphilum sp.]|nr:prolyl oligopeptidase family serine peptidase [Candidatus Rubrimentiphilum sp.]